MATKPDGPHYESVIDDLADKLKAWLAQNIESANGSANATAAETADAFARRVVGLLRTALKADALLARLQDHALGICDMTSTQVRAAEVALKKAEAADERSGEGHAVRRTISAEPLTEDEWARRYGAVQR